MRAVPGLNAGLLVGAQNEVARPQRLDLPATGIEIEDRSGLAREPRIAREYPTAMAPRAQRILTEPTPERGATNSIDDAASQRPGAQLGDRPAGQRNATSRRQFTSQRLD